MPRRPRELSSTGIYHIMLRGNEQKDIFRDNQDKQKFLDSLAEKQGETGFALYAFCIMDNHVHLLLNTEDNDLASIMKAVAGRYAAWFNWKHNRVGHVFQDRFKSEAIEDDRYLLAALRYIHNNPVKAGIVGKPSDYRWSSYIEYIDPTSSTWIDTGFILSMLASDVSSAIYEFERFSNEIDEITFIELDEKKAIRTAEAGREYLCDYLASRGIDLGIGQISENRQLCQQVIRQLRMYTTLSQRAIAELLGVDKGLVERVRENESKA